jgi:hypothetical protein
VERNEEIKELKESLKKLGAKKAKPKSAPKGVQKIIKGIIKGKQNLNPNFLNIRRIICMAVRMNLIFARKFQ